MIVRCPGCGRIRTMRLGEGRMRGCMQVLGRRGVSHIPSLSSFSEVVVSCDADDVLQKMHWEPQLGSHMRIMCRV